jgi:hypothetical protein
VAAVDQVADRGHKPALIQDTGIRDLLPMGDGSIAFCALDEAVEGAAAVAATYTEHAVAARRIAGSTATHSECWHAPVNRRTVADNHPA